MVSVKIDVDDGMQKNEKLMLDLKHLWPEEFWKLYKKNVVPLTPAKSNWLRRSIRHSVAGNKLTIWWEAKYAGVQNEGGHTVTKPIKGWNDRDAKYSTIMPGYYRYRRYTTPGTGANFREKAADMTINQFKEEFYKNHPEFR